MFDDSIKIEKQNVIVSEHDRVHTPPRSILTTELPAIIEAKRLAEKQLTRKYDLILMPCVCLLYFATTLDRSNIGNAKVAGLETELGLVGYQFNFALTAYFILHILIEIPSNIILQRTNPQIWLSTLTLAVGILCLATAFVRNFTDLVIVRVLLGIADGGIIPARLGLDMLNRSSILSYHGDELCVRLGIFIAGISLSGAFGGLLAYGLVQVHPIGRLHTWRYIFFFEGLLAITVGIIVSIFLPSSPTNMYFLTEEDKQVAGIRAMEIQTKKSGKRKTQKGEVKYAFCSIFTLVSCCATFAGSCLTQSLSLFMPTLIKEIGYTAVRANLFTVPPYAAAAFVTIGLSYLSDRIGKRSITVLIVCPLAAIGFAMQYGISGHPQVRYFGLFLAAIGNFSHIPAYIAWNTDNTVGSVPSAITTALLLGLGGCGALVASWSFLPDDAPKYRRGFALNVGAGVLLWCITLVLLIYVKWENKQRNLGRRDHRLNDVLPGEGESLGRRHPKFRYSE